MDHFNSLVDGFEGLGNILFGDVDDFVELIADMENDHRDAFVKELLRTELINDD